MSRTHYLIVNLFGSPYRRESGQSFVSHLSTKLPSSPSFLSCSETTFQDHSSSAKQKLQRLNCLFDHAVAGYSERMTSHSQNFYNMLKRNEQKIHCTYKEYMLDLQYSQGTVNVNRES